jgi:hypothetical protein
MAVTSTLVEVLFTFACILSSCGADLLASNSTTVTKTTAANTSVPTTSAPVLPTGAALGDLLAAALASAYAGAGVAPPPAQQDLRGNSEQAKGGRAYSPPGLLPLAYQPNRPRERVLMLGS